MGANYPAWGTLTYSEVGAAPTIHNHTDLTVYNSGTEVIPLIISSLTGQTYKLQSWRVVDAEKAYVDNDGFIGSKSGYKIEGNST